MIQIKEQEFKKLKREAEVAKEIKHEMTAREKTNFVLAHVMVIIGVVVTLISKI